MSTPEDRVPSLLSIFPLFTLSARNSFKQLFYIGLNNFNAFADPFMICVEEIIIYLEFNYGNVLIIQI